MREMLHRAKRLDNGQWVEGYYTPIPDHNIMFYNSEDELDCEAIDRSTLCRFTDRRDKNGERIWEKDACAFISEGCPSVGIVLWIAARGIWSPRAIFDDPKESKLTRLGSIHDKAPE